MKKYIYLFPVLSALLLTFSGPGYDYTVLSFIALVPVMYSIKRHTEKWIILATIYALVYNMINFYWVTETVNYFGDVNIIIRWVLLFLLSAYLSIFLITFFYIFKRFENIFVLSIAYVIIELIKGTLFTGFPWMNLGLNSLGYKPLAMNAAFLGELGVSYIIIFINLSISRIFFGEKRYLLHLIIIFILSHIAYFYYKGDIGKGDRLKFALVQPSYNYLKKWDPDQRMYVINTVMKYTSDAVERKTDIVVLPESSFPLFIQDEVRIIDYFLSNSFNRAFIIGNIRYERKDSAINIFNSNLFISNGQIGYYDKIHLVPFGEYFPLKFITAPIQRYFFGENGDFTPGKATKIFEYKNRKIGSVICYEDAFYKIMLNTVKAGSEIIVITTNDSWFGKSRGRDQHFALSVMRSIEMGKGIIRSSQSGISACIGPFGNIIAKKGIDEKGILICDGILNDKVTIFNKIGYSWIGLYLIVAIIIYLLYRYIRRSV